MADEQRQDQQETGEERQPEESAPRAPQWPEDAEYATFYTRVVALVIDAVVLLWPVSIALTWFVNLLWGAPSLTDAEFLAVTQSHHDTRQALQLLLSPERVNRIFAEQFLLWLSGGFAWLGFWYYYGATPGKMVFGLKLVDGKTGMPPSLKQYIIRYLGFIPSIGLLGIGLLVAQWSKRSRGWHDMMADTVVVRKRSLPEPQAGATLHSARQGAAALKPR